MAIEHANITDPQIHEPKGVSQASEGMVYVADGAGSGLWKTIDTGNSRLFQVQFAGTPPNISYPANVWTQMQLNTVIHNDISGSLSSNTVTLPAGTYTVDGDVLVPNRLGDNLLINTVARLYNNTSSSSLIESTQAAFLPLSIDGTNYVHWPVSLKGRFTLLTSSNIVLQMKPQLAQTAGTSITGIHTNLMFWKVG